MKQEKSPTQAAARLECPICNQTFQTEEELRTHNRAYHESKTGHETGSGAEHKYPMAGSNPGAERNPTMDRANQSPAGQRREPTSQQQDDESESPEQPRKRAAS